MQSSGAVYASNTLFVSHTSGTAAGFCVITALHVFREVASNRGTDSSIALELLAPKGWLRPQFCSTNTFLVSLKTLTNYRYSSHQSFFGQTWDPSIRATTSIGSTSTCSDNGWTNVSIIYVSGTYIGCKLSPHSSWPVAVGQLQLDEAVPSQPRSTDLALPLFGGAIYQLAGL